MLHHLPRVAGLLAILASLVIAPSAVAATSSKAPSSAKAKERAYGKHCGSKRKGGAAQRARCLDAMSKLASGASSSPAKACKSLSKKKLKGERKSAYARCVSEGAKLLKATKRHGSATSGGDPADADDDGALDDDEGADLDEGDDDGVSGADAAAAGDPGADDDDPADPGEDDFDF